MPGTDHETPICSLLIWMRLPQPLKGIGHRSAAVAPLSRLLFLLVSGCLAMTEVRLRKVSIQEFKNHSESVRTSLTTTYDPVLIAIATGQLEALRQLWAEGYKTLDKPAVALHNAFMKENMDIVRYLVDQYKVDVDEYNPSGQTLVHLSCVANKLELMHDLFTAGADLNKPQKNNGWTPLHIAASRNNLPLAMALVDRGVDLTVRAAAADASEPGPTALEIAEQAGSETVAQFLQNESDPQLLELKVKKRQLMAKLAPNAKSVVSGDLIAASSPTRAVTRIAAAVPESLQTNVQRLPICENTLSEEFARLDTQCAGYILKEVFKKLYCEVDDFGLPSRIDAALQEYNSLGPNRS